MIRQIRRAIGLLLIIIAGMIALCLINLYVWLWENPKTWILGRAGP